MSGGKLSMTETWRFDVSIVANAWPWPQSVAGYSLDDRVATIKHECRCPSHHRLPIRHHHATEIQPSDLFWIPILRGRHYSLHMRFHFHKSIGYARDMWFSEPSMRKEALGFQNNFGKDAVFSLQLTFPSIEPRSCVYRNVRSEGSKKNWFRSHRRTLVGPNFSRPPQLNRFLLHLELLVTKMASQPKFQSCVCWIDGKILLRVLAS